MKNNYLRALVIASTLLVSSPVLFGADAPAQDQGISRAIIRAIEKSDYESFVADGDAAFKKLTKAQFESVSSQLSPRFKSGYEVTYLGELKQKGFRVTLWKLSFEDGKDDALATLSMKDGKVGRFWIK